MAKVKDTRDAKTEQGESGGGWTRSVKNSTSASQAKIEGNPAGSIQSASVPGKRREMVAKAAYFKAEKRNFAPGFEVQDWLEAEREIRTTPSK